MSAILWVVSAQEGIRSAIAARLRQAGHRVLVADPGRPPGREIGVDAAVVDEALPRSVADRSCDAAGAAITVRFEATEPGDEVAERVASALRAAAPVVALEGGHADLRRRLVLRADGSSAPLTEKEGALLAWLAARPDQTFSRDALLKSVWGWRAGGETRTVDNTVRRLREKIEPDPSRPRHVLTVHGEGYRWLPAEPGSSEPAPAPARSTVDDLEARLQSLAALVARCVDRLGQVDAPPPEPVNLDLTELDGLLGDRWLDPGEILVREGDTGRDAYVLVEGLLAVSTGGRHIREVLPGECVGELSFTLGGARSATATATRRSRVLVLSKQHFAELARTRPQLALSLEGGLLAVTAARLRDLTQRYAGSANERSG